MPNEPITGEWAPLPLSPNRPEQESAQTTLDYLISSTVARTEAPCTCPECESDRAREARNSERLVAGFRDCAVCLAATAVEDLAPNRRYGERVCPDCLAREAENYSTCVECEEEEIYIYSGYNLPCIEGLLCYGCYDYLSEEHPRCAECGDCRECHGCSCIRRGRLAPYDAAPNMGWRVAVNRPADGEYVSAGEGWSWRRPIEREHVTRDNARVSTLYGVEFEWETGRQFRDHSAIVSAFHNAMRETGMMDFAVLKSDGSLDNGGEFVMPPAPLSWWQGVGYQKLDTILSAAYAAGARSDGWSTTGMHVHASRAWVSELHAARALLCITRGQEFWERLAGRMSTGYASWESLFYGSRKSVWDSHLKREYQTDGLRWKVKGALNGELDRQSAVTFRTRHNTSEFRMCRGTVHANRALRRVEAFDALIEWSRDIARRRTFIAGVSGVGSLIEFTLDRRDTYPHFIQWLGTSEAKSFTTSLEV